MSQTTPHVNETASGRPDSAADLESGEFRAMFEASPDGIILVDAGGRIRAANPRAGELFDYAREELVGQQVEVLVPDAARDLHRGERECFTADPHARPMGIGLELRGRRRDGTSFPVEISLSPLRTERGLFVIATIRDVTQRLRLRAFGLGALRAAEEERRRIARELHDDTAQRLAAIQLRLQLLKDERSRSDRTALLEEIRNDLAEAGEAVRRIARGLRPPALEDVGVVTALRSHIRAHIEEGGPDVEFEADPVDGLLGDEEKLVLYRVVQEALSNSVRHAAASLVSIRIATSSHTVTAVVTDDGRGFAIGRAQPEDGRGLGLVGMRERASLVGGRVEIESEPGAGTRVRLQIPVPTEESE
ncbi:MAG TPA: PAS domain S-box protein [Gemmatimonadota bacterium]|nr:PAS domain S-box protein [Gemmatimonadota bacterium]